MKKLIVYVFACISCTYGYGHESNEAFFIIVQKQNTIEIQAEFPWTMRSALIEFNPELKEASNKEEFEKTFVDYIKYNLILNNEVGEKLEFKEYKELDNNGHSHQNNYLLIFNGASFNQITNTIMLNVFEHQVNYHILKMNDEKVNFVTKQGQAQYELPKKNSFNYWWGFVLFMAAVFFLLRMYFIK